MIHRPLIFAADFIRQLPDDDTLDVATTLNATLLQNASEDDMLTPGTPVSAINGKLEPSHTLTYAKARVLGLVLTPIGPEQVGPVQVEGPFETTADNWRVVTGSDTLVPGAVYYLWGPSFGGGAGQLTTTALLRPYFVEVGRALSTTRLDIRIKRPISRFTPV